MTPAAQVTQAHTPQLPASGSGLEIARCPEWHSLRLFGRGRRLAGFEAGSERSVAASLMTDPRSACR